MAEITWANQFYTTPQLVFRLWADYWVQAQGRVPPLYYFKGTISGGFIFIAPLPPAEFAPFLQWADKHAEVTFQSEGSALLDDSRWFGHWGCFSVELRMVVRRQAVPSAPPETPKIPKRPK